MSDCIKQWPVAIIEDRYGGVYSGGSWLAISEATYRLGRHLTRVTWCLEDGPHGDDGDAMEFWSDPPEWIAVGNSPDAALAKLRAALAALTKGEGQ
jgi:predicted RNase H-like HicB family nuclease